MKHFELIRQLMGIIAPLRLYMSFAVILGSLGHLFATAIPVSAVFGMLSAAGIITMSFSAVIIILLVCAITRSLLRYSEQMLNHFVAFKLLAHIRSTVFEALRKLAPAKLEVRDKGNLISIITTDIELLEVFFAHTVSPIIIAILFCITVCIFVGVYCNPLLIIPALFAYMAIGIILPLLTSRKDKVTGRTIRDELGDLDSYYLDSFDGIGESISYDDGYKKISELRKRTERIFQKQKELKKSECRKKGLTMAAVVFFSIVMLLASYAVYNSGYMEFSGMIVASVAMMSSFGPVIALSDLSGSLIQVFASADRIFEILNEEPEVAEKKDGEEVSGGEFEFKDVTFSYNDEAVLKNLNYRTDDNHIIGLSGKSGSGKSTFLKLLMRFLDTDGGQIQVSGKNIRDVRTESLRKLQGYMTQETVLFNDNIAENIKVAKPDATTEEVIEACKKAAIHDFISDLPNGYNTDVGELGSRLSGGERQRIGLARIFLHDADMILLDEPTSNVDSLNEGRILKSIYEFGGSKYVLLVSHRESTLGVADRKIYLDNGRIKIQSKNDYRDGNVGYP